ncbi:hypothetical protein ACFVVA_38825 [Kitasatospora sp. NPDC058048]|uniref:hypothetical protein n=1 Tax=Kitasatospora sp. NPDC058048 TaxID=3346313 RepID=UPI0036DAAFF8
MTPETAGVRPTPTPASGAGRAAWGGLGLLLLVWTVFEAAKYTGLTLVLAVAGLLVPLLAGLAPRAAVVRHALLRVWIPLAVMLVCTAIPGPPEDTSAAFTFGMAWLTHLALGHALRRGPAAS